MSIEFRLHGRALLGGMVVLGCLVAPSQYIATAGLSCVGVLASVQRELARCGRWLANGLDGLGSSWRAQAEIRRLRGEVAYWREQLELERAEGAAREERLRLLGELPRDPAGLDRCGAEVIGEGAGARAGVVYIDRGSGSRIEKGMTVVAGRSVIGRVSGVSAKVSAVVLVTSPASRLDGEVRSTGERGIVVGTGDGSMRMKYISKRPPKLDEAVVARGRDLATPRYYLLGLVTRVDRRPGSLTYDVELRPARDLDRLTWVDVVRRGVSAADFPPESGGAGGRGGRTDD